MGRLTCIPASLYSDARKAGSQNKKNHHMPSVKNLPATKAHVCLYRNKALHEIFGCSSSPLATSPSVTSLWIYLNSALESFLCRAGTSNMRNQKINQIKPIAPIA